MRPLDVWIASSDLERSFLFPEEEDAAYVSPLTAPLPPSSPRLAGVLLLVVVDLMLAAVEYGIDWVVAVPPPTPLLPLDEDEIGVEVDALPPLAWVEEGLALLLMLLPLLLLLLFLLLLVTILFDSKEAALIPPPPTPTPPPKEVKGKVVVSIRL